MLAEGGTPSCASCKVSEPEKGTEDRWWVSARWSLSRQQGRQYLPVWMRRSTCTTRTGQDKWTERAAPTSSPSAGWKSPYLLRLDLGLGFPFDIVLTCGATCARITFTGVLVVVVSREAVGLLVERETVFLVVISLQVDTSNHHLKPIISVEHLVFPNAPVRDKSKHDNK